MEHFKENMSSILNTICMCIFAYIWGLLEFSFLWVIIFTIGFMWREKDKLKRKIARENARCLLEEGEEAYLKVNFVQTNHRICIEFFTSLDLIYHLGLHFHLLKEQSG